MDTIEVPPGLAHHSQFTAAYWAKAPRRTVPAQIERVTNLPLDEDGSAWVEIVLKQGPRFRRRKDEIKQLLTANLTVHVELFSPRPGDDLVTGLMVPDVGWAFRMTAQDLADYAKEVALAVHQQQQQARAQAVELISAAAQEELLAVGLGDKISPENLELVCRNIGHAVIRVMEG